MKGVSAGQTSLTPVIYTDSEEVTRDLSTASAMNALSRTVGAIESPRHGVVIRTRSYTVSNTGAESTMARVDA